MENKDTYMLKISGKSELPKPINIGHNFHVALEGSVVSETKSDNENGEFTHTYSFKPIKIDLLTDKGESLKLKDTRTASQLFRARLYSIWKNQKSVSTDFDTWYQNIMTTFLQNADELVGMYNPEIK